MDSLLKDTRVAFRMLRKNPAFALTAIVTLALGIGASTAIFSVVNAVLLRPLPYTQPDRLAIIWGDMRTRNVTNFPMSPANFRDLRATTKTFSALAGVSTVKIPVGGDGYETEQVPAAFVTTNLFSVLGTRVVMGRDFVDADATPQAQPPNGATAGQAAPQRPPLPAMMILSYEFWKRRYGGDASVIGKSLQLGGLKAQVVGVAQPGIRPQGAQQRVLEDVLGVLRAGHAAGVGQQLVAVVIAVLAVFGRRRQRRAREKAAAERAESVAGRR